MVYQKNQNDDDDIEILPFDMKKIRKDTIILIMGKRNTGKSFLVRDILYHKRDLQIGKVFSKTDTLNGFYRNFIPSILINDGYDSSEIGKILSRQKNMVEKNAKDPNIFILIDDCLSDKSWSKDSNIKEIFYNGRHYKIFFILTMQQPMGIPPDLRGNIDYTFILQFNHASDREKIFKHYAGSFKQNQRDLFEEILNQVTEDYGCLVIDNVTKSTKIKDQIFYYKAKPRDFRMCSEKLWRLDEEKKLRNAYSSNKIITSSFTYSKGNDKKKIVIKKRK